MRRAIVVGGQERDIQIRAMGEDFIVCRKMCVLVCRGLPALVI
jgi:hypothetical protein